MLPKFLKPYQINNSNLIRIGPKRDGGYVIDNRIIKKTNNLITCGLNDDWEFEKDFLNMSSMNSWIYDEDIGKMCAFLISDDALRISGQIIGVNGNELRLD